MTKYSIAIITLFFFFCYSEAISSDFKIINGRVTDGANGEPLPGASIGLKGTDKGTYASLDGKFRLSYDKSGPKLIVRSIGYRTREIEIGDREFIEIKMEPAPVKNRGVDVTGDITPEQIIERAIKRKQENLDKINTFKALLYSKFVMELDGSAMGAIQSNSISVSGSSSDVEDSFKFFVMETFSNNYFDYENDRRQTEIIQRRQTNNLEPDQNLFAIRNFVSFHENELTLVNASLKSPIADDANDFYNYELTQRAAYDDKYVYVMKVMPKSRNFPAFEGLIKIIEGTYNLIEVDLKPTEETAIKFIDNLHIIQRFEEIETEIWHPMFLEVSGKASVDVVKSIMDITVDISATSIYSEAVVNEVLPDSLFRKNVPEITVAAMADSTNPEFWEKNSLRELSEKEIKMYEKLQDAKPISSLADTNSGGFNWGLLPYLDFNRVGDLAIGANPSLYYAGFELDAIGAWSFGMKEIQGNISLTRRFGDFGINNWIFTAGAFSELETFGIQKPYPRLVNTAISALFHEDYYNFYKKDGFYFSAGFESLLFESELRIEGANHYSGKINATRSIFEEKPWRDNPAIEEGYFTTVSGSINYGSIETFEISDNFMYRIGMDFIAGSNTTLEKEFASGNITGEISIPTFSTGYGPMRAEILVDAGISSADAPAQYYNYMQTGYEIIGGNGHFISASPGVYGGEKYLALHFKYNLTDLWWRAMRLPVFDGRGPDLHLAASAGNFAGNPGIYTITGAENYYEAGFGLSRIPTFISNVFYLKFDARWGAGKLGEGNFGWAIGVSSPF
jgi:hypothetical protein